MSVGSMPARGQVFSTPPKEVLDAYSFPRTTRGAAAMPLHFCHPNTPHRKLRMPDDGKNALCLTQKAPYKGLGAESGEKREPASDIDTGVVDSLKALDPEWPIREASRHPLRRCPTGGRPTGASNLLVIARSSRP